MYSITKTSSNFEGIQNNSLHITDNTNTIYFQENQESVEKKNILSCIPTTFQILQFIFSFKICYLALYLVQLPICVPLSIFVWWLRRQCSEKKVAGSS
uniref:Uncharacterized protein n=1 Tax=Strongyloides venezuelensis TaxID=75913 RepID=A0A0K0FLV0_STRVS